ncbi:hypothetical protein [Actibacterium sp. 188UL27-1]|uniref:hypothetical protein n=1 Tax=Actibacterium sp. 188UL27-1 TaxID=2786961 RepID=UPI0019564431|nr:hypothetical protein [Actibacterium sp. 188UL27-1]MBM7068588.1 hypothetical protein [Actibacterium sp. 188UL27-1]
MNKLNDMLFNAAKLAAQKPNRDEALDWSGPAMARAFEDWLDETTDVTAPAILIDMPLRGLDLRRDSASETTVIWSARSAPTDHAPVQDWQYSARIPTDLSQSDQDLWTKVSQASSLIEVQQALANRQEIAPWIATGHVDQVLAPFLMNTLPETHLTSSLKEIARVLSVDGRFQTVILAADEPLAGASVPFDGMELTSFPQETEIGQILTAAGLHGVRYKPLLDRPYMTISGVELRAFGISAHVGTKGVCLEQGDAAIYLGPWSSVSDDDGHDYPRGVRIAVCAKTAAVLQRAPYAGSFAIVEAYGKPPLEEAAPFDCSRDVIRPAAETKGVMPIGTSAPICIDGDCDC